MFEPQLHYGKYCALLKEQLRSLQAEYCIGETADASRTGDAPAARSGRDVPVLSGGEQRKALDDEAMKEHFRLAFLRAGQIWDQTQAGAQTKRRHARQEDFQQRLARLLDGEAYANLGRDLKERLLEDVPNLAFSPKDVGR